MKDPVFKNMRCLIHAIDYGCKPSLEDGKLPEGFSMLCPMCVQKERTEFMKAYGEANKAQRIASRFRNKAGLHTNGGNSMTFISAILEWDDYFSDPGVSDDIELSL